MSRKLLYIIWPHEGKIIKNPFNGTNRHFFTTIWDYFGKWSTSERFISIYNISNFAYLIKPWDNFIKVQKFKIYIKNSRFMSKLKLASKFKTCIKIQNLHQNLKLVSKLKIRNVTTFVFYCKIFCVTSTCRFFFWNISTDLCNILGYESLEQY